ncbi:MAG: hypothetical protein KDB96_13235 [Flavobacteriales bacterium]|nr:hypothetical protein [Flavobacteriales bacterium]MCB9179820.1 hypothetical protein [Flavobacteriales bacterium]
MRSTDNRTMRKIRHAINKVPVFTARPIHSAKVFQRSGSFDNFVIVDEIKCMKMWITVPVEYRGREVEEFDEDGRRYVISAHDWDIYEFYCDESQLSDGFEKDGESYIFNPELYLISSVGGEIMLTKK